MKSSHRTTTLEIKSTGKRAIRAKQFKNKGKTQTSLMVNNYLRVKKTLFVKKIIFVKKNKTIFVNNSTCRKQI